MRMHVITHVDFEGPELIAEWAAARAFEVTDGLALSQDFPPPAEVDFLVVMGGPMAADDDSRYPWLATEKRYLSEAIDTGCRLLGVCLGAQIIAEVTGGAVRRGRHPEIGFFPVTCSPEGGRDPVFSVFPDGLIVGYWHGDTFDPPPGAIRALSSVATPDQAFSLEGGRTVGLQFHLEWTSGAVTKLIESSAAELAGGGPHTWSASALLAGVERFQPGCRQALWALLDRMMIAGEEGR